MKRVIKTLKNYFYSNRMVDEWNSISKETVNAEKVKMLKEMCESKERLRDGAHEC